MKTSTLLLVGLVAAAGCSTSKPQAHQASLYPQSQPDGSQPPYIYVDGEVKFPGEYHWTNGMTLQDAVKLAGGFTDFAPRTLRVTHNGSLTAYRLGPGRSITNNPPVYPGDQIYSPRHTF